MEANSTCHQVILILVVVMPKDLTCSGETTKPSKTATTGFRTLTSIPNATTAIFLKKLSQLLRVNTIYPLFTNTGLAVCDRWQGSISNIHHQGYITVSYTHLRAHETRHDLVCR